jgi:hypothetical protein
MESWHFECTQWGKHYSELVSVGGVRLLNVPSSVFRKSRVIVVNKTCLGVENNILENRTELDRAENVRFLLSRETNTFRVALILSENLLGEVTQECNNLHHPRY